MLGHLCREEAPPGRECLVPAADHILPWQEPFCKAFDLSSWQPLQPGRGEKAPALRPQAGTGWGQQSPELCWETLWVLSSNPGARKSHGRFPTSLVPQTLHLHLDLRAYCHTHGSVSSHPGGTAAFWNVTSLLTHVGSLGCSQPLFPPLHPHILQPAELGWHRCPCAPMTAVPHNTTHSCHLSFLDCRLWGAPETAPGELPLGFWPSAVLQKPSLGPCRVNSSLDVCVENVTATISSPHVSGVSCFR